MTNRPQIVVDTGVLVSALLIPKSIPRAALELAIEVGRLLISDETYQELANVLGRKRFQRYVTSVDRERFLGEIAVISQWVMVTSKV